MRKIKFMKHSKLIEKAENGDLESAIKFCELVCPNFDWTLKSKRAMLRHQQSLILDVDWVKGETTASALLKACMKAGKNT